MLSIMRNSRSILLACLLCALPVVAQAATLTVCASGCTYTNTQLQTAINAAVATTNDIVLLQEGQTYVGDFVLPVKAGAGPGAIVTIRSGVNSTGVVQATSRYPAANIRICPAGVVLNWMDCTTRAPQDMTRIAKLTALNNNLPALTVAATATGATPVSYYNVTWLEFVANTYGGNAIVVINNTGINQATGSSLDMPHHIVFDQVVIRGLPYSGQFRGLTADATNFTFTNSFVYDIKAVGEGQAVWFNGGGPFTITNNYINGGTETLFTGGSGTAPEPELTVLASPTPTVNAVGVSGPLTDLYVGKDVAFHLGQVTITSLTANFDAVVTTATPHGFQVGWEVDFDGTNGCTSGGDGNINSQTAYPRIVSVQSTTQFTVEHNCTTSATTGTVEARFHVEIGSIASNVLTFTTSLPILPTAGAIINTGMVIQGMTIRYNVFTHPSEWFTNPRIVPLPTGSTATAFTTGGTLTAGTYGYRVLARWKTAQDVWADSGSAAEVSATTTGTTGRVVISWNAVTNAQEYLVYARTPGAQTRYFSAGTATTFTDTGSNTGSTVASVDTSATRWQLKNVFEIKQGLNIVAQYNLIEQSWFQGQSGPCVLFTGTQQNNDNWSAVVRDVDFSYNEVRHCNQSGQISGTDAVPNESARSGRIYIHHNLFWDLGGDYGGSTTNWMYTVGGGPRIWPNRSGFDITFNHNTFGMDTSNDYQSAMYFAVCSRDMSPAAESPTPNFILTNNIFYAGTYGLASEDPASGCGMVVGRLPSTVLGTGSQFHHNVLAGASSCSIYTDDGTDIYCPSVTDLESLTFTGPILTNRLNYAVKATSPYYGTASDATNYGADIPAINTAMIITESGNNTGGGAPPPPLTITTTSPLPTATTTQTYSVTLGATGGTAPYTWAQTAGILPGGLAFDPTTASITGTPTTAVDNRSLTFRVTDATTTQVSKVFLLTVARHSTRARRYNWTAEGSWVQGTAPINPIDQVEFGDRWFDAANSRWMTAVDVPSDPTLPITWDPVGGADLSNLNASSLTLGTVPLARLGTNTPTTGQFLSWNNTWQTPSGGSTGAPPVQTVTMFAGLGVGHSNVAAGGIELEASGRHQIRVDVQNSTQIAVTSYWTAPCSTSPAAVLRIDYWDGSTFVTTGATTPCSTGLQQGTFVTLPVAARAQMQRFRAYITDGDTVADPQTTEVILHFR